MNLILLHMAKLQAVKVKLTLSLPLPYWIEKESKTVNISRHCFFFFTSVTFFYLMVK